MAEAPTLADYIEDFKKYLMYERNASAHTLRCYMGDLEQFHDFLCPPNAQGARRQVSLQDIDHITIREYLATLYRKKKKKNLDCSQTGDPAYIFSLSLPGGHSRHQPGATCVFAAVGTQVTQPLDG